MESDLLKEAIADAKAVRQTALANAKVALEEAFSQRYHAMFAEKLKEEASMDEKSPAEESTPAAEENISEQEIDELIKELESEVSDEVPAAPAAPASSMDPDADGDVHPAAPGAPAAPENSTMATVAPGAQVTVAPGTQIAIVPNDQANPAEQPPVSPAGEVPQSEVPPTGAEEDEEVNLDELLQSLKEEIEDEEEGKHEEEEGKVNEAKKLSSSGVASSLNKKPSASASSSSGIESGGMKDNGLPGGKKIAEDPTDVTKPDKNFDGNKNGNLAKNSPLKEGIGLKDKGIPGGEQTSSEDPSEVTKSEKNFDGNKDGNLAKNSPLKEENSRLKKKLNETEEVVRYIKGQLNEVNLLNAKLLYTNKLFKEYGMNNEQKMRIVEMFDLAKNVREVKLTYANIAESLNFSGTEMKKKVALAPNSSVQSITEGLASKQVASTKPSKEIISESKTSQMVSKFQKLAGIKKS